MLCEKLVDTPVRGLVYEGAGTLPAECWPAAPRSCGAAAATWSIPVEIVRTQPEDCAGWTADAVGAVAKLLG